MHVTKYCLIEHIHRFSIELFVLPGFDYSWSSCDFLFVPPGNRPKVPWEPSRKSNDEISSKQRSPVHPYKVDRPRPSIVMKTVRPRPSIVMKTVVPLSHRAIFKSFLNFWFCRTKSHTILDICHHALTSYSFEDLAREFTSAIPVSCGTKQRD